MSLIEQESATANDLEKLIGGDPSLTLKILRLANSPVYGGKVKVSSIGQAVVRLGMTQLKNTILLAATGDLFDQSDPYIGSLWEHSIATSMASRWLATELGGADPEDAFVAGMLHDIGKIHIYNQRREAYIDLLDTSINTRTRFYVQERETPGSMSHEMIGLLLARKWGLSKEIVEVIRFHHEIEENPECVSDTRKLVALVSTANIVCNYLEYGPDPIKDYAMRESVPAEIVGLDEDKLEKCREIFPDLVSGQLAAA